jgi:general secretion pathway protein G
MKGIFTKAKSDISVSRQGGFTLIEVMVVIAIIGIMASLIVPRIMSKPDEARVIAAKQDIGTIVQALKLYRLDIGRYPTSEQGLQALLEKPSVEPVPENWKPGGYLEKLPKDPWGNAYQYTNPGTHAEIDVFSFGADNKPGGARFDADLGNWQ